MITRCYFCHREFEPNESLEHFRLGRRIAFDPGRGRLWAVCNVCRRWSLAPIETRWEALEELERLTTDRARLLSQTDNIALLRAGELEVVKVGRAELVEEAWWRYGRELLRRRSRSRVIEVVDAAALLAVSLGTGFAAFFFAGEPLKAFDRWRRFGGLAWSGTAFCTRCGDRLERVRFKDSKKLVLVPEGEGELAVHVDCRACRWRKAGGFELTGATAEHVLRRVLMYQNYAGASEKEVRAATQAIDEAGSPHALTRRVAENRLPIGRLVKRSDRTRLIALEIAVSDDVERRLLELELADLEVRWREEEELAAIVDRELTPVPLLDPLLRRLRVGAGGDGGARGRASS